MKRICFFSIASLILSASLMYSADFWEKKEFLTWNEDEVSKLLQDSPWACRTFAKFDWISNLPNLQQQGILKAGGGTGGSLYKSGGYSGVHTPPPATTTGGYREEPDIPPNMSIPQENPWMTPTGGMGGFVGSDVPILLRWHSALPIKQAVAILRYQDKVETSEEAAKMIHQQESTYILGVIGMPGQQTSYNNELIRAGSQLIIDGNPPIKAIAVVKNQDGENTNLYIAFPRYQNNAPLISLEDKNVEVVIEFGIIAIKKEFKLKDMRYRGKLEI